MPALPLQAQWSVGYRYTGHTPINAPCSRSSVFVILVAFYPLVLILSHCISSAYIFYSLSSRTLWKDYIYSPSTLYDTLYPFVIYKVISVLSYKIGGLLPILPDNNLICHHTRRQLTYPHLAHRKDIAR